MSIPENADAFPNPITLNTIATDLVVGSIIATLEELNPGFQAKLKEKLEGSIAALNEGNPKAAASRAKMFDLAREMVG